MQTPMDKIDKIIETMTKTNGDYPYVVTITRTFYQTLLNALRGNTNYAKVVSLSGLDGIYYRGVFVRPRSALDNVWED